MREHILIGQMMKARQHCSNLCGDRIVAFAMPPQYQLGLLFEVL